MISDFYGVFNNMRLKFYIGLTITTFCSAPLAAQFQVLDISSQSEVRISCSSTLCLVTDRSEFFAKTYNGGSSFTPVTNPSAGDSRYDLCHTSDSTFYLKSNKSSGSSNTSIFRTINAGNSWKLLIELEFPKGLFYMHNDSIGFLGGTFGNFYRTKNGWDDSIYSDIGGTYLSTALFINDSVGFIGEAGGGRKTIDTGTTWVSGFGRPEIMIRGFAQLNSDTLLASAREYKVAGRKSEIFRSVDNGDNWESEYLTATGMDKDIFEIVCPNNVECFAVGQNRITENPILYRSMNKGVNWHETEFDMTGAFTNIEFVNDSIALIGGDNGILVRMNRYQLPPPPRDTTDTTSSISEKVIVEKNEIFPNPVQDQLRVKFAGSSVRYTVFGITGNVILKGIIRQGASIDFSNMEAGVYLLLIEGNQTQTFKVIKQ